MARTQIERFDGSIVDLELLGRLILAALESHGAMASFQLRDHLGYSDEAVRIVLSTLKDRGLVVRHGTGSRNWKWRILDSRAKRV